MGKDNDSTSRILIFSLGWTYLAIIQETRSSSFAQEFFFLLHVSCSSPLYWAKPGAEPGDFDRDVIECRRSLATGSGGRGALNPVIGIPQSEVDLCLSKKGWFLAKKPADVNAAPPSN